MFVGFEKFLYFYSELCNETICSFFKALAYEYQTNNIAKMVVVYALYLC